MLHSRGSFLASEYSCMVAPTANVVVTSFKSPKLATFATYLECLHITLTIMNFKTFSVLDCCFNVNRFKFLQQHMNGHVAAALLQLVEQVVH